jgi:cysteine dioxygenase
VKLDGSITWDYMIDRLLRIFDSDSVNVEEVEEVLSSYKSDPNDWHKYAKFDKYRYTRNLVHEGNGKFNLVC